MKRIITAIIITLVLSYPAFAQAEEKDDPDKINYIPLLSYDYTVLGDQKIHSPGGGLVVQGKDALFVAFYKNTYLASPLERGAPDRYHSITTFADIQNGRNNYLAIFRSESDRPVAGGFNTFLTGGAYGYQFFTGKSFSLTAGAGLYLSDVGVDLPDGKALLIVPCPLLRIKSETDVINTSFEFISGPNLNVVVLPKSRIRLTGEFSMNEFRDARDMIFDFALAYRFFDASHEMGDFAGVSAGIKSAEYSFDLSDNAETTGIQYYGLYGKIDLSFLAVSGGYTFEGIERHGDNFKKSIGDGYFVAVQGAYQF